VSEPHQMYVLIPAGVAADRAVATVHRVLLDEGATIREDEDMLLNDLDENDDREFEPIGDPEQALERLVAWPTLGSIVYSLPGSADLVSFEGRDGMVRAVILDTPATINVLAPEAVERYRRIGNRLHNELSATRTVMGWGLSAQGRRWDSELERAAAGDTSGSFELRDLHG
jgi:hypothetical protein